MCVFAHLFGERAFFFFVLWREKIFSFVAATGVIGHFVSDKAGGGEGCQTSVDRHTKGESVIPE